MNSSHQFLQVEFFNDIHILDVRRWFHGTDKKSAIDICERGIKPGYAKPGLGDFSDTSGFYISPHILPAYEKSRTFKVPSGSRRNTVGAIIVFEDNAKEDLFPQRDLEDNQIGMCFQEANDEWKELVKNYRDQLHVADKDTIEKEKMIKYIYGPVSCGSNTELKRLAQPDEPPWKPMPALCKESRGLQYQLCIRDDQLASNFFEKTDITVIFLK